MLDVTFRNPPPQEPKTAQCVLVRLDDFKCVMDGPASDAFAETRGGTWWVDGVAFATAEIRGQAVIRFETGPTLGPFSALKMAGDSIYSQEVLLVERQRGRWVSVLTNKGYEKAVISPVTP
jgi:hypothetical protein